jgi:hypothetical protein
MQRPLNAPLLLVEADAAVALLGGADPAIAIDEGLPVDGRLA